MTDPNGLYQMRARYYNPEIKRFVNRDVLSGSIDDVIVSRTIHPKVTGIYEIEYRLPALDRELTVVSGQYKTISQPKTVYDPSVVSNEQIITWGKEAMNNGVINSRLVNGYSSNGLRFTGYLDNNGNITNFHPSF